MSCYIISYDLRTGADYTSLHNTIKSYGTWAKITESTWAIVTSQSCEEIRNRLSDLIGKDNRLFVIKSGGEAAWRNSICKNEWLQKNIPN